MRLASSFDLLKPHYEVVVVGSGYGGSIAACRLAAAGHEVCVLERGKELQPGEYPNTLLEYTAESQVTMPGNHHFGSRTGLFDLHAGDHMNVFQACGLGGTSLINANVSIQPDRRVFTEYGWPQQIRNEAAADGSLLWQSYAKALNMLGANPYPTNPSDLSKLDVLGQSATGMGKGGDFSRAWINVTFEDGKVSGGGVKQAKCTRCGDCMTGCNYGAKNTTLMNYLPDAKRHGASIFTKCSVRYIERAGDGWTVAYQRLDSGDEAFDAPPQTIAADLVILSAGALGSTEILLRSARHKVQLSKMVGEKFSGNGDVLGFGYNVGPVVNGMGWGRAAEGQLPLTGPGITGVIDLRQAGSGLLDGLIVEEGAVAGAISSFMPEILAFLSLRAGVSLGGGGGLPSELESILLGPHHGALQHTQTYLGMGHDGAAGILQLSGDDQVQIVWPNRPPIVDQIDATLEAATAPLGGTYIKDPIDAVPFVVPNTLTTVHPLGGCGMADSADHGVVNADCQVFSGSSGTLVYGDLYVMDGSVVPCPLGVNPSLTISALAERAMARLLNTPRWSPRAPLIEGATEAAQTVAKPGADFSERWRGVLESGAELALNLNVVARNLDALLGDPEYRAEVHGTAGLTAGGAGSQIFAVTGGLGSSPGQVVYELKLTSSERSIALGATRAVPAQPGPDAFAVTSALKVGGPAGLSGTLQRSPNDWKDGLGSVRIYNVGPPADASRLSKSDALARRLGGPIADVYANVAAEPRAFAPAARPVKRRSLLAPAAELDYFEAGDRLVRLLRYPRRGRPVLLMHSLGQSSRLFSLSSIQPNMVEFLHGWGFDVWLLDDRGSIAMPGSAQPFDLDQIAGIDLPAAVQRIQNATASDGVILFAHGWGAAAAWMWLVRGQAQGVAAFIASQMGPIIDVGPGFGLASRLHTATIWRKLGSSAAGGYTGDRAPGSAAWRLSSSRRGLSPSQVVTSVYGQVLRGENLSRQVDAAVPYLYGPVAVSAVEHVQAIARAGRVVDAAGHDTYLSRAAVPPIPMLLLHGADNRLSRKSGIDASIRWLRARTSRDPTVALLKGYGHDDSIIGHLAPAGVYPEIAHFLEPFRLGR